VPSGFLRFPVYWVWRIGTEDSWRQSGSRHDNRLLVDSADEEGRQSESASAFGESGGIVIKEPDDVGVLNEDDTAGVVAEPFVEVFLKDASLSIQHG